MKNCPALAYSRDEHTGAIIHNADKCIGCKYCTWTCPYDAPKFNPNEGVVEKCNFCTQRIEEGKKPACANLCPTGALDFATAELNKKEALISSPVPVETGSSFRSKELRRNSGPEMDLELTAVNEERTLESKSKISAKEEWPLYIFTLLVIALLSLYLTKDTIWNMTQKLSFLGAIGFAAILSSMHLGKKLRAWRAIFNLKSSWLSREIFLFGIFKGLVFLDMFFIDINTGLLAFVGMSLLLSIDMLYTKAHWEWPFKIHSAQSLIMSIALMLLLSNWIWMFVGISILRLALYAYRKVKVLKTVNFSSSMMFIRLFSLIFSVGLVMFFGVYWPFILLYALGEFIDRFEYYDELDVPTPKNSIQNTEIFA